MAPLQKCSKVLLAGLVCFALVCLYQSALVQSQFFTKTSKSIPRMGRRSDPRQDLLAGSEPAFASSHNHHQQQQGSDSDSYTDQLGLYHRSASQSISGGPSFVAEVPNVASLIFAEDTSSNPDLNPRSSLSTENLQKSNESGRHGKLTDALNKDRLAMRALYLSRLSQQLNSGQQFLTVPQLMPRLRLARSSASLMRQLEPDSLASEELVGMIQPPMIIQSSESSSSGRN